MTATTSRARNAAPVLRGFLLLEAAVRFYLWTSSLTFTFLGLTWLRMWPTEPLANAGLHEALRWSTFCGRFALLFHLVYLGHLLVLRALLRGPREGTYTMAPGQRVNWQVVSMALVSILVKAKGQPPFPAFLLFHIANLPPFCWLVTWVFGPRSRSVLVLDPPIPDPHLTEIGRNVIVGNMTSIIAHTQYRDGVELRKTVIEDDVMIGAHALVYSGCTIKRGAVVYGGAIVRPNTVIGENEAWGGGPAKKLRDLPPLDERMSVGTKG